jgi:hypothetical protein
VPFSVCFSVPTNKAKQKDDNPLGTVITLRSVSLACTNSDMVLLKIGNFAIKTFAKGQIRDRRISKNLLGPLKRYVIGKKIKFFSLLIRFKQISSVLFTRVCREISEKQIK